MTDQRSDKVERCDGRYPVPGPRSEPFEVTYRCGRQKGHEGACGENTGEPVTPSHVGEQRLGAPCDCYPQGNPGDCPAPGCGGPECEKCGHENGGHYPICEHSVTPSSTRAIGLTFDAFRDANVKRCVKWHPAGIESWSPSDWLTAVTGELGELASLLKMRNRERDHLPGNKFSPTDKQVADELADVLTYLDLLAAVLGVDLGKAAVEKFNEVSERVGFPDRITVSARGQGISKQVNEGHERALAKGAINK